MTMRIIWCAALLLATSACGAAMAPHKQRLPPRSVSGGMEREELGELSSIMADSDKKTKSDSSMVAGKTGGQPAVEEIARKIIYTARFYVDVYDLKEAQTKLIDYVKSLGGYMQQTRSGTVVLRIPAEQFELMEPELKKLGRVDDARTDIRAQDVTEEFYDVELRLKTKKNYVQQLYKLLDSAGKLKDKLAVQKEIARVVEEIESLEGRLRYLAQHVSFATVTVTFRLATSGPKRTFRLPWEWLDELGVEYLIQ